MAKYEVTVTVTMIVDNELGEENPTDEGLQRAITEGVRYAFTDECSMLILQQNGLEVDFGRGFKAEVRAL